MGKVKKTLLGLIILIVFGSCLSTSISFIVKWRAASIAGDAPYCMQITKDSYSYREVDNWHDLTWIRMRVPFTAGASSDFQFTFHALLIVKASDTDIRVYNWSNRQLNFDPVSKNTMEQINYKISCVPAKYFLNKSYRLFIGL